MNTNQLEQWAHLSHDYWECCRLGSVSQNRQRFVAELQKSGHVINNMTFALETNRKLRQQVLDIETSSQLVSRLKREISRVFGQKPTKKPQPVRWSDLDRHTPKLGRDPMWDGAPRSEARARGNECQINHGKDAVTAIYGNSRPVGSK